MEKTKQALIYNTASICLCFLLTSTGFFLWMNRLGGLLSAAVSDVMSTVIGYTLQAAGVVLYAFTTRRGTVNNRRVFAAALITYVAFLVPATLSHTAAGALSFGFLDSLLCGVIAGHYLYQLTFSADGNQRAASFGIGYGLASVASWLFSLIPQFYTNGTALIGCALLAAGAILLSAGSPKTALPMQTSVKKRDPTLKKLLLPAATVVLLFSLVNNIGFATQAGSSSEGVHLEFSRMFYAIGLVTAGIVSDKSRKNGAVCALAALSVPFIALALHGEPIPLTIFWGLGYFGFGFYAVYRVILFSDMAKEHGVVFLASFGLLFGRLGDAAGTGLNLLLKNRLTWLITVAAALFALSVFVFFKLYQLLYIPHVQSVKSEREIFHEFAAKHDLSQREREVLKLVLSEKSNKEMAEALYVSESTVKFHIHNLLKKTGAKTRLELLSLYHGGPQNG